jgi:diketogulonate reductase-like aldo/keto reductase
LQLSYLDQYIIHWPFSFEADGQGNSLTDENGVAVIKPVSLEETWKAMESLVLAGKVKSIGVSNFSKKHLEEILSICEIPPAVNQVELHPYLPQWELLEFCEKHQITLTAYSPLGSGFSTPSLLHDELVIKAASIAGITPAQMLIAWAVQRGTPVIPKTANVSRLRENLQIPETVPQESMKILNSIEKRYRFINPVSFWKRDCF